MIQVLGIKRVLIIVILVAVNAALAAGVYMYLQPERLKKSGELNAMRAQVSKVRQDIGQLELEFSQLQEQQAEFEVLKEKGFFSRQERNKAERLFEQVQNGSNVISASIRGESGEFRESDETEKASHVMLVTPLKVNIDALEDTDVFRYLYLLKQSFPGHVSIQRMSLERRSEITKTVLRSVASGSNPELVKANIDFLWWTMIPKPDEPDR